MEVLVVRGRDQRTSVGRIRQTRSLPDEHVTEVDGFPVVTLARMFFELCAHPQGRMRVNSPAHEQAMILVYNDCLGRRGMTFTQELAVLLVLAKRGRGGTCVVRRILERFGKDHKPTKSDLETLLLLVVFTYELPPPEQQVSIVGDQGWIGTVDFYWRDARLVVEVDSSWHDGPYDKEVDADRDAEMVANGFGIKRIRYGEIVLEPAKTARELGVAIATYAATTTPRTRG